MGSSLLCKKLLANMGCFGLLLVYTLFGGLLLLHFEREHSLRQGDQLVQRKLQCIRHFLQNRHIEESNNASGIISSSRTSEQIAEHCLLGIADPSEDRRRQAWNFRNALLYGFGILTTLGYGKIEPETIQARLFTVLWGFFGVPFTVIILTNLGLYMRRLERYIRRHFTQHKERILATLRRLLRCEMGRRSWGNLEEEEEDEETVSINPWLFYDEDDEEAEDGAGAKQISPFTMAAVVFVYLAIGALLLPLLKNGFDFINGLFYSYLCFTAIEYGHLIPENNSFIPIVLIYMCVGLAMSTIALDIGSNYVRRLYYLGRRATNIAHATFFYGGKQVTVSDLFSAVGQAIGIGADTLEKVDFDQMVDNAIAVKEGQMDRVPQNYVFLEGIWPPELIPLFQREGRFPEWVDAELEQSRQSIRTAASSQLPEGEFPPSVPALSLSTFANGCLHRSLHSTSSTRTPSVKTAGRNNNNNNNNSSSDIIPL